MKKIINYVHYYLLVSYFASCDYLKLEELAVI